MKYLFYVFLVIPVVLIFQSCGKVSESTLSEFSKIMGLVAVTSPRATSSSKRSIKRGKVLFSGGAENLKPMKEMMQDMEQIRDQNKEEAAKMVGNPLEEKSTMHALCYGPKIKENSRPTDVDRPLGDLGLFYETASKDDKTACAASELNALVAGVPQYVNKFIAL